MNSPVIAAMLVILLAAPATAQDAPASPRSREIYVSPYAGYMLFGTHFSYPENENPLFRTRHKIDNALVYGAQLGYGFSRRLALIGNVAYTKSDVSVRSDALALGSGETQLYFYDANLQLRFPFTGSETRDSWTGVFGQVGLGAATYETEWGAQDPVGETSVAYNLGIGGDFRIVGLVDLRFMVKDYITTFRWAETGSALDVDVRSEASHNVAVTTGLHFAF